MGLLSPVWGFDSLYQRQIIQRLATPVPIPTVTVTAAPDIKIQVGNDQYVRSVRQ